jgi:hypothetical protein
MKYLILKNSFFSAFSLASSWACLSILPFSLAVQAQDLSRSDGFLGSKQDNVGIIGDRNSSFDQVTNVSQLRDIEPTVWAYEALRSLVERYGCIVGYPDRTFRGNRALTRWEFAAGLNACINTVERLLQENVTVLKGDLDKLKRLSEEFKQELASLGVRIDNLDQRVSFLEDHSFSTTTKLNGEIVVGLVGVVAGEKNGGEPVTQNPTLGYRARLQLNTSFNGDDLLYTRLATGNVFGLDATTGTFQSTLSFNQPDDNKLAVEVLRYEFQLAPTVRTWLFASGGAFDDFVNTLNVLDGDGATGAFTAFGTRNPIYYTGEGSGIGFQGEWGNFQWSLGYLAFEGSDPAQGQGLFNGPYGAIAQIGYNPSDNFGIALTYINGYNNLDTNTGSVRSNFQFFADNNFGQALNTANNSYGVELSWKITDGFVLGGWGGLTKSSTLNPIFVSDEEVISRGKLDIWNWAVTLAFPDLFKEGSIAGLIVGMQPWVSSSTLTLPDGQRSIDQDTSLSFEAFYQYALSNNIFITPGILVVTSPNYNYSNGTLVVGTIRTTFKF